MKNLISIACLFLFFSACKESELPPNVVEDPVFKTDFSFGGKSFSMAAGENNFYMFSSNSFNHQLEVNVFSGAFAPVNCPSAECSGSLKIDLRNSISGIEYHENQSITIGEKKIFDSAVNNNTTYILNFSVSGGGKTPQLSWDLDGAFSGTSNPASQEFLTNEPHYLSVGTSDAEGFKTYLKYPVFLDGSAPCPVPVLTAEMSKLKVTLQVGAPISDAEIDWPTATGIWEQAISGSDMQVAVTVNYPKQPGCAVNVGIQRLPSNNLAQAKTPTPAYSVTQNFTSNDLVQLGSATLQFVDSEGVVWKTDGGKPAAGDVFEILEKENYLENELGEPTLKLKANFKTTFYNAHGESKTMEGTAVFAVSHK